MEKEIIKEYTNGEVTIVWKPASCIHSTICWKEATGMPQAFNPRDRPWIKASGNHSPELIAQVKKCPSGALSYYLNKEAETSNEIKVTMGTQIEIITNGPLLVYGNISIKDKAGHETRNTEVTAFCRCGHSQNKPYCDGSHIGKSFKG